jgi:UDP-hydrolysing UDP-N-acetyl-D-glucosamine 2-epimerase
MSEARRVAVVTGTRAEFGLLRPVMSALQRHQKLQMQVIVTGTHLLPGQTSLNEIESEFEIAASLPMQVEGASDPVAQAAALGRGIAGFATHFARQTPDILLVLGDRIEAFAGAAAGSVSGVCVAHMHGGDRAEGFADEAIRHAITKLAHVHLPATMTSAQRIIAMGEAPERVHVVGSPAMDGLDDMRPLSDAEFKDLGHPEIVLLLHPTDSDDAVEQQRMRTLLKAATGAGRTIALHPNHDPGRVGIIKAMGESSIRTVQHLPREKFIGLLRRAKLIIGNSSAGLIEGAAVPIWCLNIGSRQNGREKPGNVIDVAEFDYQTLQQAIAQALAMPRPDGKHPYGTGDAGTRTALVLASTPSRGSFLRKLNTY